MVVGCWFCWFWFFGFGFWLLTKNSGHREKKLKDKILGGDSSQRFISTILLFETGAVFLVFLVCFVSLVFLKDGSLETKGEGTPRGLFSRATDPRQS